MRRAERYRAKAEAVRQMAARASSQAVREALTQVAQCYDDLAKQVERLESVSDRVKTGHISN
jgi:hypothetical protein